MLTHTEIRGDRRRLVALTGLTPAEFALLLKAFARAYERRHPTDRTAAGRPRRRRAGAGRKGALPGLEQKLLFLLVYLKTYPLQAVMAELFGLSQPGVNYWLGRLLPALRDTLDELGVLPERNPRAFAQAGAQRHLIIDGTERRRQRPKNPEKQAAHSSGRKKLHCDRNVLVAEAGSRRVGFLSRTHPGRSSDKGIADREGIAYPPGTVLDKDSGFQGYEPAGVRTRQAKKKAGGQRVDASGKARQPEVAARARAGGTHPGGRQALPHRQGHPADHGGRLVRFGHGGSLWVAQPSG